MWWKKAGLIQIVTIVLVAYTSVSTHEINLIAYKKEGKKQFEDNISQLSTTQKFVLFKNLCECQLQIECAGVLQGFAEGTGIISRGISCYDIHQNILSANNYWQAYYKVNWINKYETEYPCEDSDLLPYTTQYGRSCYKIPGHEFDRIDQAQQVCMDTGMELITLETSDEFVHVTGNLTDEMVKYWINLQRLDLSGEVKTGWYWGSLTDPLTYSPWLSGHPFIYDDYHCAAVRKTGVSSKKCYDANPIKVLCEKFTGYDL